MEYPNSSLLVNCNWLNAHLENLDLVIVDCGLSDYAFKRAHIPGAIYRGSFPYLIRYGEPGVMKESEFTELVRTLGLNNKSTVVLYDDFDSKYAARFWWMLRYYGFENIKLLNGGWQSWSASGYKIEVGDQNTVQIPEDIAIKIKPEILATKEWLLENYNSHNWQILDVRSVEEYEGKEDRGNKRSGRVPGSINWEWSNALKDFSNPDLPHTFKSAEDIQRELDEIGLKKDGKIVTYCQAGVRASLAAFTLELMGYPEPRMYDASMAEWANSDDTPLE